ncbi:putative DNA binding domain-containing protein [Microvirga sp. STS02]|uniref:ATP-binding protein n=1 Tax=Hymenobacter negativus TaxID=2795026 RepID=UPI0018DD1F30|nr:MULTISPECIES: ATP-binding protein [Bacteria]MBH8569338.1 putative DNA binding domain-containing protein [Hymenobacter negativus]MBR7209072.1 putative DNA binding domain-containing protein [Microvirga sp. STS02]
MDIPKLIQQLNSTDENHQIEAKRGSAVDVSFFETVNAFANEPDLGGGHILLGLVKDESSLFPTYNIVGVEDADKVGQEIASGCATRFNNRVRPNVETVLINGKRVIGVFVPESSPSEKPIYFLGKKLPEGAFRRIGPTDQSCTDDDMVIFYGDRQAESFDKTALSDADMSDIDVDAIEYYRKLKTKVRPSADDLEWDNHDVLRALTAIRQVDNIWRPTVTGILLFGTKQAQRRLFPMMRVDYIRVQGKEWVENPDERFYTVDMRGPLLQIVQRVQNAILDDLPKGFFLPEGSIQAENPTLSTRVLREAVVNALMHRSYKVHGTIQVIRYSNRIEIINPGYSLKAEERLGEPGSENRNPHLAAVFYETNVAENKGSGIKAMRNLMRMAKFAPPTFESDRKGNRFVARLLLQHLLSPKDLVWLLDFGKFNLNDSQKKALLFMRETGAIDNRSYRQFNSVDMYTATRDLRSMRASGLIEMRGQGTSAYYIPGVEYKDIIMKYHDTPPSLEPLSAIEGMEISIPYLPEGITISPNLSKLIYTIRASSSVKREVMIDAILQLCSITPFTALQLSEIFKRKYPNFREKFLSPLIKEGVLEFTIPESPSSSHQAYKTFGTTRR